MEYLKNIQFLESYNKVDHDIAQDFYIPAMSCSSVYDRLSGYFGSTIFIIAWAALKQFINNGGKLRIICSPCLSPDDVKAIQKGEKAITDSILKQSLAIEINEILKNPELHKPFEVLSWLISEKILEIKIAYGHQEPNIKRLFHDKVGIFRDCENSAIMFRGSLNETYKGLSNDGNFESIDVFTSWLNKEDAIRITTAQSYFDRLWSESQPNITVISLPPDIQEIISKYAPKSSWEQLIDEITVEIDKSSFWKAELKGGRVPRKHQSEALYNWVSHKHRGILEHATGSGKTYTSLCAIRYALNNGKAVLILVPSSDLLNQWHSEVRDTFKDLMPQILLCGDSNSQWKKGLLSFMTSSPNPNENKITIASMDTAVMDDFLSQVRGGNHLFIVADEVHRLGSPKRRKILSIDSEYRLGVSATPRRYNDPEGTYAIMNYFGGIIQPIFTLEDAIRAKVLTPYFYTPRIVNLTSEEQEDWNALSKKIRERFARLEEKSNYSSDSYLQTLLLQRSRLLKKAKNKIRLAVDILTTAYQRGQRWIVYCEDIAQLKDVIQVLSAEAPDIDVMEYYADMEGDRKETLELFTLDGGVIVSIKCLDEGVDIPATTHAIILASSKNPREFIQRRGRVLRRYPDKYFAWVYDAIVVPSNIDNSPSQQIESLVFGELCRAIQFANWAETSYGMTNLKVIARNYGVDINKLTNIGIEDE